MSYYKYKQTEEQFAAKLARDLKQPEVYVKLYLSKRMGVRVSVIDHILTKSVDTILKTQSLQVPEALAEAIQQEIALYKVLKNDKASQMMMLGLAYDEVSKKPKEAAAEDDVHTVSSVETFEATDEMLDAEACLGVDPDRFLKHGVLGRTA